jgi:hypothetical protein
MERRRRCRHASPKPKRVYGPAGNPDNVIPTDRPLTNDEIITGCGRALMRLGPLSNREFVLLFSFLESLRERLGPDIITNELIAWVFNLSVRGLSQRKIIIIQRGNDLTPPNGTKVPTEEDL